MILWHDSASGLRMRWSNDMNEGGIKVDIAAQMKTTLAQADDNYSNG
jgi:hypothetical protein